jgi:hypothetical protein
VALEGFEKSNASKWDQPTSPPRESVPTTPQALGSQAVSRRWNFDPLLIVLSQISRATKAARGGLMISRCGEVKADFRVVAKF